MFNRLSPGRPQVIQFIARRTQIRLRESRIITRFINSYGQYVYPTQDQQKQLECERIAHARQDADWNLRHGPVEGGAIVLRFGERPRGISASYRQAEPKEPGIAL